MQTEGDETPKIWIYLIKNLPECCITLFKMMYHVIRNKNVVDSSIEITYTNRKRYGQVFLSVRANKSKFFYCFPKEPIRYHDEDKHWKVERCDKKTSTIKIIEKSFTYKVYIVKFY